MIPDSYIPPLFAAMAFITIFLIVLLIVQFISKSRQREAISDRIIGDKKNAGPQSPANQSREPSTFVQQLRKTLSSVGKRVVSEESPDYAQSKIKFLRAGLRRPSTPPIYWGLKSALVIGLPFSLVALRFTIIDDMKFTHLFYFCVLLAFSGFYLPDIWLRLRISKRKEVILKSLPDALDLLVVCVEAGLGLDAAFNRVAQEIEFSSKELADEFKVLNLEIRAGKLRRDALKNLAIRTNIEEMHSLTTLIIQTEKFGTSIAQALKVYADSFRTKRYQKAEELAAQLPVKLMLPLILFIFPSLFVAILGPAAVNVYHTLLKH